MINKRKKERKKEGSKGNEKIGEKKINETERKKKEH